MATLESDVEFILQGEAATLNNQRPIQVNAEDIRWLQEQFLISADKAEKALRDAGGNREVAATALICLQPSLIRKSVV